MRYLFFLEKKMADSSFDYILVLDFEATCIQDKVIPNQEIIEFPVVCLNGQTGEVMWEFHRYVKPEYNPKLSSFCTELTGITQNMVQNEDVFKDTLRSFTAKLLEENILRSNKTFTFVTVGDWDLHTALPKQCKLSDMRVPIYFRKWINIKVPFKEHYGRKTGLVGMLTHLGMKFEGNPHSGIDDTRNTVRIVQRMIGDGIKLENTSWLY